MEANVGDLGVEAVMADRGYDSSGNSVYLHERGIAPVIHKRRPKADPATGQRLHPGGYTTNGAPACECGVAMDYVGATNSGRYLYRCSAVGDGNIDEQARDFREKRTVCAGKYGDAGVPCREDAVVDPKTNVWLFGGRLRRMGPEWRRLYRKRWSAERVISLWKGTGRLNAHRFRDRLAIALHVRLQALAHLATALTALQVAGS